MHLRSDAGKNILAALHRFRELGVLAPSIYELSTVISIRQDQRCPSQDDVLRALEPLIAAGVVVESFDTRYIDRHFRAA